MRELSKDFINDLKNTDGLLYPILARVKQDDTLMLAVRENYINIYYRGGNILKIAEQSRDSYTTFFDLKYNRSGTVIPVLPRIIKNQADTTEWVNAFSNLKEVMDLFFSEKSKAEREFQQLVARENNSSTISNESEYFVSDIEFADKDLGARFDILAIRWLASHRSNGATCRPALIEMKYGDGALGGTAGLLKHLQDNDALISNSEKYQALLDTMESQFNQLDELGLLNFHRSVNAKVKLNSKDKPEVIIILANHNPRSTKLSSILNDPEVIAYGESPRFDLKFFVSSFSGYGLHSDCMLTLAQFKKYLKNKKVESSAVPE